MLHYTKLEMLAKEKHPSFFAHSEEIKEIKCCEHEPSGLYYEHITIVNDAPRVASK